MDNQKNIHNGHRERMCEKALINPEFFADHELLEILLFFSIPRKDVNPLAHKLLRTFGGLEELFSATVEKLTTVDGVGKKTAVQILAIGEIYKRISSRKTKKTKLFTPEHVFNIVKEELKNSTSENFIIFLLNKSYSVVNKVYYSDKNDLSVSADPNELIGLFAVHKPKFLIVAHNHILGTTEPSESDLVSTRKLNLLCSLHGVEMLDHVICCKDNTYSFRGTGLLEKIKNDTDINKILTQNLGGEPNE